MDVVTQIIILLIILCSLSGILLICHGCMLIRLKRVEQRLEIHKEMISNCELRNDLYKN